MRKKQLFVQTKYQDLFDVETIEKQILKKFFTFMKQMKNFDHVLNLNHDYSKKDLLFQEFIVIDFFFSNFSIVYIIIIVTRIQQRYLISRSFVEA